MFYGLGTIIGAGIYVLIGEIIGLTGAWAPLAFLIASGVATFTGLSYSELVARHPRSAGEAEYILQAFSSPTSAHAIGWAVIFTGIVSAATLINGFTGYAQTFIDWPAPLLIALSISGLCTLACIGVSVSVGAAVIVTLIELAGLILISCLLIDDAFSTEAWQNLQHQASQGIQAGTLMTASFIAFYAFIGFEDMVNMAEEVEDVSKKLPKAIILALIISALIYSVVAILLVLTIPQSLWTDNSSPLTSVVQSQASWLSPQIMTCISLIAIINGVMVQLLMVPRVIYGLTQKSGKLTILSSIHPKTQTPINATLLASGLILIFAISLPLTLLAKITSWLILLIFITVNISLIRIKQAQPFQGFQVPMAIPWIGILTCATLLLSQIFL